MPFDIFQQLFLVKITFLKGFFDDVVAFGFAVNGKILPNPFILRAQGCIMTQKDKLSFTLPNYRVIANQ